MNIATTPRLEQFLAFYNGLSSQNMQKLQQLYHADVSFIDPVHELHGRDALTDYFNHAYARLQQCKFCSLQQMEQGDHGFLSWQMQFSHSAISKNKTIIVQGCSVLRWQDGLIIYHRDYYDLSEMVFQHLPVLGWLTDKVKHRMANGH